MYAIRSYYGGYPWPAHPNRDVDSSYVSARWSRVLGEGREGYLQFYHNQQRDHDLIQDIVFHAPTLPLVDGVTYDDGIHDHAAERYDLEGQFQVAEGSRLRLLAGAGMRLDRFRSEFLTGQEDYLDNFGGRLFGQAEFRLTRRWLLNAGFMAEHSDIMDTEISPRVGLIYVITSYSIHYTKLYESSISAGASPWLAARLIQWNARYSSRETPCPAR